MTTQGGWEAVAETGDVYEAELIALRLREAGLPAEVIDQSFRQEPLPAVRSFARVRVMVPAARAAAALEALGRTSWLSSDLSDDSGALPALARPQGEDDR